MKTFILLPLFCCSFIFNFAQSGTTDPTFGKQGFVNTNMGSPIESNVGASQVLAGPDGSFYSILNTGATTLVSRRHPNGTIDPNYGASGYSKTIAMNSGFAAIQADNKILLAGIVGSSSGIIARLNEDGTADTAFGSNGLQTAPFILRSVAIQDNGKIIVVGGVAGSGFAIVRYNTDGSPDSSFTAPPAGNTANCVAIQVDGKILVGGFGPTPPNGSRSFLLVRYNPNGSLDSSFDNDGQQITSFPGNEVFAYSMALQTDGKIVLGGYSLNGFAIARYQINGSLDSSFNGNGRSLTVFPSNYFQSPNSLAIQPDGKIVIAGYNTIDTGSDFVVARFTADGRPDSTFDSDGILTTGISTGDVFATSVVIQGGNKILVAGYAQIGVAEKIVLAQYNENGSLDNSFGTAGKTLGDLEQGDTYFYNTAIQPDGKILAAGNTWNGTEHDFAVVRYNDNGDFDSTFGSNGKQITDFAGDDIAISSVIQPDGKIIVAGYKNQNSVFGLIRYTVDGKPDSSFNGNGKLIISAGVLDVGRQVAIQADGKIVVAGYNYAPDLNSAQVVIARINNNGTLDSSFSGDGLLTTGYGNTYNFASALAIQTDGKIVVSGRSTSKDGETSFGLLRINVDGSPDTSFSQDGRQTSYFGPGSFVPAASAILANGKIVLAGYTQDFSSFVVAHYTTSGTLDTTFSNDGFNVFSPGGGSHITIAPDGRIAAGDGNFAVTLYKSDGTPDSSFNSNGTLVPTNGVGAILDLAFYQKKLVAVGFGQFPGIFGVVGRYLVGAKNCGCPRVTIANGNWNEPTTWINGVVPDANSQVIVRHHVSVIANAICYSLKVEPAAGSMIISSGVNLTITH